MKRTTHLTAIHKYLRMEFIFTVILIIAVIAVTVVAYMADKDKLSTFLGLGVVAFNMSILKYDGVRRGINVVRSENAKVLFDAVNANFQMLVLAWKDLNVSEVEKYKSKWNTIISIASDMKENGLITKQVYKLLLQSNISYADQETKIRLENMRGK